MNFGMILGGIAEGAGAGLATKVAADRAARLEELAQERADRRSEREMSFRSEEAKIGRDAQVQENIRSEGVQAHENQLTRDAAPGDLQTAADGSAIVIKGGKAITVTKPDGSPVKLLPKATDDTEAIKNAKYMLENGIAKNANEAWTKANRLKDKDPDVVRDTVYRDWIRTLAGTDEPDVIDAKATELTEKYMEEHYPDEGIETNVDAGDPAAIGDSATKVPPPDQRELNKIYMNSEGKMARWTAQGWAPVGGTRGKTTSKGAVGK